MQLQYMLPQMHHIILALQTLQQCLDLSLAA